MLKKEFEDYEDAATGELLSMPEFQVSLVSRDSLYTASLAPVDREQVELLDEQFLSRALEVRAFVAKYGDPDIIFAEHPPQRWWWHLPRIAAGKMSVNLRDRVVTVDQTEYSY
ncbi:hypothetical protein [Fontibacillus sp. BL9]|uniref:hypothetical protein n=1 Tax=Fontibacillus sp. BL9 TaxID=3389971 RepID=UPI00397B46FF